METAPRAVCLVSDANRSAFPYNKPWNFTNAFPQPLIDQTDRRFTLQLRSVVINGAILRKYQEEARLLVHVSGIEPQVEGRKLTYRIGSFPIANAVAQLGDEVNPARLGKIYYEKTFHQSPPLPLKFQHLNQLSIRITTEEDNEVHIENWEESYPTIIMLELEEDEEDRGQFTVTCRSHGTENLHPSNELGNFFSPLPSMMNLKDYEVALQSIVYPPLMKEHIEPVLLIINNQVFNYTIDIDTISTSELIKKISTDLQTNSQTRELRAERHPGGEFIIRRVNQHVQGSPSVIAISCSFNFLVAMAGPGGNFIRDRTVLRRGEAMHFGGQPEVARLLPFSVSMLECDIISPNIVGDRRAQLLQLIPVFHNQTDKSPRIYEPAELLFQPVEEIPFSQIGIRFTHPDGTQRHFISFTPDVKHRLILLTLVFRKRHSITFQ